MRSQILIIGIVLFMFAIPGYFYTPILISQLIHSMMGSMPGSSSGTGSLLHQMGYPSREVVVKGMQYSFAGLAVAGIGLLFFGAVAKKKIPKQFTVKPVVEEKVPEPQPKPQKENMQQNIKTIRILQERLARGEIAPNEFQSLKRLLE